MEEALVDPAPLPGTRMTGSVALAGALLAHREP